MAFNGNSKAGWKTRAEVGCHGHGMTVCVDSVARVEVEGRDGWMFAERG